MPWGKEHRLQAPAKAARQLVDLVPEQIADLARGEHIALVKKSARALRSTAVLDQDLIVDLFRYRQTRTGGQLAVGNQKQPARSGRIAALDLTAQPLA